MKTEDVSEMMLRLQRRRYAVKAAHTPQNEAKLIAESNARGMKLTRRRKGEEGYALKLRTRQVIDGISLAEVDAMLKAIS